MDKGQNVVKINKDVLEMLLQHHQERAVVCGAMGCGKNSCGGATSSCPGF
jgi:hypothetical protein